MLIHSINIKQLISCPYFTYQNLLTLILNETLLSNSYHSDNLLEGRIQGQ